MLVRCCGLTVVSAAVAAAAAAAAVLVWFLQGFWVDPVSLRRDPRCVC